MSYPKPQTPDPAESHTSPGPVTGPQDFSGQDPYDEPSEEGAGDVTEVPVRRLDTSNPCNGSGGTSRTIDPAKVKGINP